MISHPHKTIFIHIPKCAGQSIETAFLHDLALDWKKRAPLLLRPNDNETLGPPRLAHLCANDYVKYHYLSQDLFDRYYKFAVVRNPWSRVVSLYRYLDLNLSFDAFVSDWIPQQLNKQDDWTSHYWFIRPQGDFVAVNGKIIVDDIIRFETLKADFETIKVKSNLRTSLPHVNSSPLGKPKSLFKNLISRRTEYPNSRSWTEYYSHDLIMKIKTLYYDDINMFDYQAPST